MRNAHGQIVGMDYTSSASRHWQRYDAARAFIAKGDYDRAKTLYQELIWREPNHPAPWIGLASAQSLNGEWKEARENYLRALELDPESLEALYGLGGNARDQGDLSQAKEYYEKVLANSPTHSSDAAKSLIETDE